MITGGILEVASFGAYTIGFGFQEAAGLTLISHGLLLTSTNAQDLSFDRYSTYSWKNANLLGDAADSLLSPICLTS